MEPRSKVLGESTNLQRPISKEAVTSKKRSRLDKSSVATVGSYRLTFHDRLRRAVQVKAPNSSSDALTSSTSTYTENESLTNGGATVVRNLFAQPRVRSRRKVYDSSAEDKTCLSCNQSPRTNGITFSKFNSTICMECDDFFCATQRVGAVEMAAHDAAVVMIQPVNFVLVLVTINAFAVSMILLAQQAVVDAPC